MLSLVGNENMKIYRRARTWVLVGLLVVLCFLISFVTRSDKGADTNQSPDWRAAVQQDVDSLKQQLADKNLPAPIKSNMQGQLKIMQYELEHNIPPSEATLWGGVQHTSSLVTLVTLFTVIVAGDAVASEFTWGTIKLLLIRPASRAKILLSKYAATMLFALFLLGVLLVSSFLINGVIYGFGGMAVPSLNIDAGGAVKQGILMFDILEVYVLKVIELVMVVSLAFMISSVFRSSSLAIGLSIFIMLTGQPITMLLLRWSWGKYFLFANTDLTQYLSGEPLAAGMSLSFSIAVLVVYFILFNALSWATFTKRDVAA